MSRALVFALGFTVFATACGSGANSTADALGVETTRESNGISVERTAELTTAEQPKAGHRIIHRYTITNSGASGLVDVRVNDPAVGRIECLKTDLAPDPDRVPPYRGESMVCEADGSLSQTDVDQGAVPLEATVVATTTDGERVDSSDKGTLELRTEAKLRLTVETDPPAPSDGEQVEVRVIAQNKGKVTLTNVVIELPGASEPLVCNPPGRPSVPPEGVVVCEGVATAPISEVVASSDQTSGAIAGPSSRRAVLSVNRTGVLAGATGALPKAGDAVAYTYEVSNLGGRSLTGLVVDDDRVGTVACAVTDLTGGDIVTCTSETVVTQNDIDTGYVASNASASALDDDNNPVTAEGLHTLPLEATGGLAVELVAANPKVISGGAANLTASVTNTGNATLAEVTVVFFVQTECGRVFTNLGAGETQSWPCLVPEVVSDIVITAQADAAIGNGEWSTVKQELTIDAVPKLTVEVKSVDSDLRTGGHVGYSILVVNAGGASDPLSITSILDSRYGDVLDPANTIVTKTDCKPPAALAAGFSYDCWFQVSLVGVPVGKLENELLVIGVDDENNEVRGSATTVVYLS